MNTIMAYLDNMFNGLPKTAELNRIKQDLLTGMEEKYYELKSQGKSENEAIGIVISEFGNIDELTAELGIYAKEDEMEVVELTETEVSDYMNAKRSSGAWSGIGVFLILLGVAFLTAINALVEQGVFSSIAEFGGIIGLIGMFVFITSGVCLFIVQGMKLQRFDYFSNGFKLSFLLKADIKNRQTSFAPTYRASIIVGVCISILSPIIILLSDIFNEIFASYTVSLFLIAIGVATFIFIYYGNIQSGYTTLLEDRKNERVKEKKEKEQLVSAINSILWILAVAIFLIAGLVFDRWDINWVIFVIASILSGMSKHMVTLFRSKRSL